MISCLDCTLRDGGYYNNWDFDQILVEDYLAAMDALHIDYVEIGFRSLINNGFKGGYAFSTDSFLRSIKIPKGISNKIGVMVNGSELSDPKTQAEVLKQLFREKTESPVTLVRIACHVHEFVACLPAAIWLKKQGYLVGFNIMQVADRTSEEIYQLAKTASDYPIDVLYFADSMGSLNPHQVSEIVQVFRKGWKGPLGIHTHDNMGQAIANTVQAVKSSVTWVDSTVTGMGRGPGNAQTEYLIHALADHRKEQGNPTKLFKIIKKHFKPLQIYYEWGTNPHYYLAGKYGIHPSYIQEMLQDSRYDEEDIIAVIEYLRSEGGKKFSLNNLEASRQLSSTDPQGTWKPQTVISGKTVLILGSGPGVKKYKSTIEKFIKQKNPYVIALNTQSDIDQELINVRAACHPVRILADCHEYLKLPQPLIAPLSTLPSNIKQELESKEILNFGACIDQNGFEFHENYAQLPTSLVVAYVLAVANSGQAKQVLLAGFDGYNSDDPRRNEMDQLFRSYHDKKGVVPIKSITPTFYNISIESIYGMFA